MAERRVPRHLRTTLYAWVLAIQHGFEEAHVDRLQGLAARIVILPEGVSREDYEANQVALAEAGWSL